MYLSEISLMSLLLPLAESELEAGSRPTHGHRRGFRSKRDNGSLVACYSRVMVVDFDLEH